MKKYKHKQTGANAELTPNSNYYITLNNSSQGYLLREFVENTNDWEEIKEKEYEILAYENICLSGSRLALHKKNPQKFSNIDKCIIKKGDIGTGECSDFKYAETRFNYGGTDTIIYQVKRLSDEEIFSIGDETNQGIIIQFIINDNYIYVKVKDGKNYTYTLRSLQNKKQLLFLTEDGIKKYVGDTMYSVNEFNNWTIWNVTLTDSDISPIKWWSSEKAAQEYILLNKPCLSVNDVINKCGLYKIYQHEIIQLAKSKI